MLPATVLISQFSDITGHRNTIMGSTKWRTCLKHTTVMKQNEKILKKNNNNQLLTFYCAHDLDSIPALWASGLYSITDVSWFDLPSAQP